MEALPADAPVISRVSPGRGVERFIRRLVAFHPSPIRNSHRPMCSALISPNYKDLFHRDTPSLFLLQRISKHFLLSPAFLLFDFGHHTR